MKRTTLGLLLLALAGASLAGGAVAPTVKTAKVAALGRVLVSSTGRTLYHYSDEAKGRIDCKGACAKQWPPLLVRAGAKPVAGPGLARSRLGVVERPEGTYQVTYRGLPLYRFAGDTKAGQANGEALEHEWYALSPAGTVVKPKAATGGGSSSSASSSSTGGSGYGYG